MRISRFLRWMSAGGVMAGATFFFITAARPLDAADLVPRQADLANGERMFNVGACASCHATPKQADRLQLGGGYELKTSFGTFVSPNISSDRTHGIGAWTEADFVNAMQRGIGRRGEHLYPAFPYTSYQRMALNDVRDLYAFMKTVPAVGQPAPPHQVGFPFNIRRTLGAWKLLYLDGQRWVPEPGRTAEFNRGAYLVEGPGHCAECHSRRNLLGAITADGRFAGGPDAQGKGFIPNITPHADGLANWTVKDMAYMLETGFTPDGVMVGDSMAKVVENTARLSVADRNAMAVYLMALPPRAGRRAPAPR
jgi:mono/diheme cytochrome c family protein